MISPETISGPSQLKKLNLSQLARFADQVKQFLINTVSRTGGQIGANLSTVDLSAALHYAF